MKAFVVYFIFLILQHATSLDTSTVKITSTENHPSNDLPTTDNPSTESNALPMIAGSEQPVGPDTYDFLNTPAILIDAPMDISTTTDATTTTIKPIDNPVVDPFAFYLTATCCDLRRCHTNMDCINYEDRWGCRCELSSVQKIQRMKKARMVMARMGLIEYFEPYTGDE
ncbi:uncharacterized protein LOC132729755 [Ruditapes philippinarum]|uniref:uncharacterized protein LOC132729755 n=1 Tax=Ruditapes philippinarum TaxID=129788 RepID=UPI00295B0269|nr:uncharacterized protein LOC132729755 [Ruditapes philippinarum]